jgi:hypothetical protein
VPMRSPRIARVTLPCGCIPKTIIGILLSMQRLNAVESTTLSSRRSASSYVSLSIFFASGLVRGSES